MNLECLNNIITSRLGIHIDLTDLGSWNLNTGLTSFSITKWSDAVSDDIDLYDFGLTAYDNGRVNDMLSGLTLTSNDLKLQMERVGYNNSTGGTFYDTYGMTGVTASSGNYFELNGGYLQGFFKLQDENYTIFPARYGEGITIETIIRIDTNSSGIFYYMGSRAEDKYNPFFSGETQQTETTTTETIRSGYIGQSSTVTTTTIDFSGVTTSENNHLNGFLSEDELKNAFVYFDQKSNSNLTEQPTDATYNNVISFGLTSDKHLFMKKINGNGLVEYKESPSSITETGWTIINITFRPDEIIENSEDLKCAVRRTGDLVFSVNGRESWKLTSFDEFYFTDIKNHAEKTYGNSYNISWGGGSFGLKNSWHWDLETYNLYSGDSQAYIDNNYSIIIDPLLNDNCDTSTIISGSTGNSIILVENDSFYTIPDECDPETGTTESVIQVQYSGATGSSRSEYFINYDPNITLLSNRDYDFSVDVYDTGIFQYGATGSIGIVVYNTGTTGVTIVSEIKYSIPNNGGDVYGQNEWQTISAKIQTPRNSGRDTFNVGIFIESNEPITENGVLYLKDFKYSGSDVLVQDSNKSGLGVEKYFNDSYIGGIQKLRVYDVAFTNAMIMHNARYESINNDTITISIRRGGRIINT